MADTRIGATQRGTTAFAERMVKTGVIREHYRILNDLRVSSIGIGTYLGDDTEADDVAYAAAVIRAVELGTNFIDTAINYRHQRSEHSIGAALRSLFEDGKATREEIVVATKGGFIPTDGAAGTVIAEGLATADEIVTGSHCMTPRYLRAQIEHSLTNLGLESVDLYYLHNPETQLRTVDRREFSVRLQAAFEALEQAVDDGLIGAYGVATWDGFRLSPEADQYLSVEEVIRAARAAASGKGHHLAAIQVPFNLVMHEAYSFANQMVAGKATNTLDAAAGRGIEVVGSGSILQGQLAENLPDIVAEICPGLRSNAQRALQFARSAPNLTASLCGMKTKLHVEENLELARLPAVPGEVIAALFGVEES